MLVSPRDSSDVLLSLADANNDRRVCACSMVGEKDVNSSCVCPRDFGLGFGEPISPDKSSSILSCSLRASMMGSSTDKICGIYRIDSLIVAKRWGALCWSRALWEVNVNRQSMRYINGRGRHDFYSIPSISSSFPFSFYTLLASARA